MRMITVGLFAASLSAMAIAGTGVAAAAPSGTPLTFDCSNGTTYTAVANSGNSQALTWNPFFITAANGQTAEFVMTANDIVVTFPTGTFAPNATKGGTAPGSVTCSVSADIPGVTVGGSVTGNIIPT